MSNDQSNGKTDLIKTANIAAVECRQDGTAIKNIVPKPVPKQPTGNGKQPDKYHKPNPALLDFPTHNATLTITCEWCGAEIVAKRPWKRFCDGTCRQRAFQARLAESV